jgi:hypothetical protein
MPTFNTDTPKPGYVYDSTDDTWYPLAGIAIQSLDGLTDVVISSAASGQTLVYNGTNWVNTAETGDVSAVSAGTGITVTNGTGPIPSVAVDTTLVATTSNTMTLSNKTLTAPTLQNPSTTGGTSIGETIQGPSVTGGTFLGASITSSTTFGGTSNTETIVYPILNSPEERMNISASTSTGTINVDLATAGIWYYTNNAAANHTVNFRFSSNTSLLSVLTSGDSITAAWMNTNGSTAYYPNVIQVDGTTITPKWQGGTAPSSGNASSVDIYTFTIARVSSTSTVASAVTVFGSQTKFA